MIQDYFILSLKNLKHRGVRSWLTLLGIIIGVTAVIALISLGNGLQLAVSSQFGISATEVITVQASGVNYGPPGSGAIIPLNIKDIEAIEKLSNVKIVARKNIGTIKLEYKDVVDFSYTTSIPDGNDRKFMYELLDSETTMGRLLKDGDVGKVFLGYNYYAENKGWGEKKLIPGKTILLQDKKFEVVGILEKKGSFIFDNAVFINDKDMENLLGYKDNVDIILVKPVNKELINKAKEDIEKLMRKRRDVKIGEEDFTVSTPEAELDTVNSILGGVQAFIVIIASISIFIGAIGIINTMTTSVLERKKEIGIMKAIGAKNNQIFLQFFIESGLLGLIGGIIGAIFGTLIGIAGIAGINNFIGSELVLQIDLLLISFALFGSFAIGALAGIIPAMSAAKLNPVDALK
ncbi:MAG: ABC transporter permease [Nanoarchaeota archaeon]